MSDPQGVPPSCSFRPIDPWGEHFTVGIDSHEVGTFQWVPVFTTSGPSKVGRVYHRSGGMPAIVGNEVEAIEWLLKVADELDGNDLAEENV